MTNHRADPMTMAYDERAVCVCACVVWWWGAAGKSDKRSIAGVCGWVGVGWCAAWNLATAAGRVRSDDARHAVTT